MRDRLLRFLAWYPAIIVGASIWCAAFVFAAPVGMLRTPTVVGYVVVAALCAALLWHIGCFVCHRETLSAERGVVIRALGVAFLGVLSVAVPKAIEMKATSQLHPATIKKVRLRATVQSRTLIDYYGRATWSFTICPTDISCDRDLSLCIGKAFRVRAVPPAPLRSGDIFECHADIKIEQDDREGFWKVDVKPDWSGVTIVSTNRLLRFLGETKIDLDAVLQRILFQLYGHSARVRELLSSLLFGCTLDKEMRVDIHRVGVDHLFAISGYHFSCIAAFAACIAVRCSSRIKAASIILWTTLFLFIIGFQAPSVLRSWWSILITCLGVLIGRKAAPINSLGVALAILVFHEPDTVFTMSFQLSFMATWGLLLCSGPTAFLFSAWIFPKRKKSEIEAMSFFDMICYLVLRVALQSAAIAISVWIFIVPYLFCFLDGLSPIGIFYNLILPPLFSLALVTGLVSVLLFPLLSFVSSIFQYIASRLIEWSLFLIDSTEGSMVVFPTFLYKILSWEGSVYIAFLICSVAGMVWHVLWRERVTLFGIDN